MSRNRKDKAQKWQASKYRQSKRLLMELTMTTSLLLTKVRSFSMLQSMMNLPSSFTLSHWSILSLKRYHSSHSSTPQRKLASIQRQCAKLSQRKMICNQLETKTRKIQSLSAKKRIRMLANMKLSMRPMIIQSLNLDLTHKLRSQPKRSQLSKLVITSVLLLDL